ncbi:MAG: alpha-L-rhamnosidase N-terminal domain-containing protein [Saprospiraceae bacterium]|nr:alpha-L-rhamnosidase N-terminal domain-containing protein [Lewinella sp.]
MKNHLVLLLILALFHACNTTGPTLPAPSHLRCNFQSDPKGLLPEAPFFTWWMESTTKNARQTYWQIQIATDPNFTSGNDKIIWDSDKQAAGREIQIPYDGPSLQPTSRYYWRVRLWDEAGNVSPFSEVAQWETGPGVWAGKWISDGSEPFIDRTEFFKDHPSPLFRKTFELTEKPEQARLYISGLGYYEAFLNGDKIGKAVLDPGWTDYGKHCLYNTYEITGMLQSGRNALGVMLGNGWYNPMPINHFGRWNLREILTIGQPKLIAELHLTYVDGRKEIILSDESWQHGESWILYNDVDPVYRKRPGRKIPIFFAVTARKYFSTTLLSTDSATYRYSER